MRTEIAKLVLIYNFGRHSRQPLRAALIRLIISSLVSVVAGLYISRAVLKLPLATDIPALWLSALAGLVSFTLFGLISLTLRSGLDGASGDSPLSRQLWLWPLNGVQRWLIEVAPTLIIWALLMIGASWVAVTFYHQTAQPAIIGLVTLGLYSLSGLALGLNRNFGILASSLSYLAILVVGGLSLQSSITSQHLWYTAGVYLPGLVPIASYLLMLRGRPLRATGTSQKFISWAAPYIRLDWYIRRLLRNRSSLGSALFCLTLNFFSAAIILLRDFPAADRLDWLPLGTLLGLAFCVDVRGLARRQRSPETNQLSQTAPFVATEYFSAWLITLGFSLPLFVAVSLNQPLNFLVMATHFLALQAFAAACGLLAGSLWVPRAGEIGAQFFAATAACFAFVILPVAGRLSRLSIYNQSGSLLAMTLGCLLAVYLMESWRRRQYGHA